MMKTLRRLTTSLMANFDWAVSQIENHEALVNSAMREIQHASAKAKVQIARVRRDGEMLRAKLKEQRTAETLWAERALRCASLDQSKALACLKERRRAQAEIAELEVQIKQHEKIELDLNKDLESIEQKVEEVKRRRNTLRSRQSTAEALTSLHGQDAGMVEELDNVFERWEIRVSDYETSGVLSPAPARQLAEEFSLVEEEASLKCELEALLVQQTNNA